MRTKLCTGVLVVLILGSAACGDETTETTRGPSCQFLSSEVAEAIITDGSGRLVDGEVSEAVALRSAVTQGDRVLWVVYLMVGETELLVVHYTPASVGAPGQSGWRIGRWLSYDEATREVLSFPLSPRSDEEVSSLVTALRRCTISGAL